MEQCPLCYTSLEVRTCAPCHVCGGDVQEITHFIQGIHTYNVYDTLSYGQLTLCNICEVDIGSYKPEYWGSPNKRIGYTDFSLVREIAHPQLVTDKVCPVCGNRKPFLYFVAAVRASAASD